MKTALVLGTALLLAGGGLAQDTDPSDPLEALADSTRKDTIQLQHLLDLQSAYPFGSERDREVNQRLDELSAFLMNDVRPAVRAFAGRKRLAFLTEAGSRRIERLDLAGALSDLERARELAERLHDEAAAYLVHQHLAFLYNVAGEKERMQRSYQDLLDLAIAAKDTFNICSWQDVVLEISPDEDEEALDRLLALLDRYAVGKQGQALDDIYFLKGHVLHTHKRWAEALEAFAHCTDRMHRTGTSVDAIVYYFAWLGSTYHHLDSLPQAIRSYQVCQQLSEESRLWAWYCPCSDSLGRIAASRGDRTVAEREWRRTLRAASENGYTDEVAFASERLRDLYKAEGRTAEALAMTELWVTARDSLARTNAQKDLMRLGFREEQRRDSIMNARDREEERLSAGRNLERERTRRNVFLFSGLGALLFGLVVFRQRNRIRREKERSEELLLNILPSEVAQELKDKGEARARDIDQVSILFTDFKGFTEMSEQLSAQELVAEINTCFKAFDGIIGRHGVEKIKTIGDAYMAAGGLPLPSEDSARNTVLVALEMQAFMSTYAAERVAQGKPAFTMRVGIHTGPVVAGIVGVKKFAYDIWGDTVNIASRMESSGEVGRVNISESTHALVRDGTGLAFTARGKVSAKGKGELEMYFVRRADAPIPGTATGAEA